MNSSAQAPVLPGLVVERLLGAGAHAEVWAARTDGGPGPAGDAGRVAVKVARGGATDRLRREAGLLERVRHPHVVRLLDVVEPDGGGLALVLEHAGGGSVADLLAVRGGLGPREVTTVVVPVARALAALHRQGVVHGDVTAANVLLTAQGRPMLVDLGVAAATDLPDDGVVDGRWGTPGWTDPQGAGRTRPGPDADIWALGALIRFCLTGDPTGDPMGDPTGDPIGDPTGDPAGVPEVAALLAVARRCEASPRERPGALEVARMVWDGCPPAPIRLPGNGFREDGGGLLSAPEITRRIRDAAADAAPPRARGSLPSAGPRRSAGRGEGRREGRGEGRMASRAQVPGRLRWAAAAVVAGLVGAGLVAVLTTRQDTVVAAAVTPSTQPSDAGEDLVSVVRRLSQARAEAFVQAAPDLLASVDAAGSPALAADAAVLAALRSRGVRYRGLGFDVRRIGVVAVTGDRARVTATVATSAHRQVDQSGGLLAEVPAGPPRAVTLVLVRTADGWRVESATEE